ncbi:MAG: radical SAM protein [Candidatus Woesearchaeota archaeon]
MRIVFAYLPMDSEKYLTLSQCRFSAFRSDQELIYPMTPAMGVTLLKNEGFDVSFIDGIYESLSEEEFLSRLKQINPELLIFEAKTPTIKQNWRTVERIKNEIPGLKVAVVGDHISVLPKETLENSRIDYVLTGGDFDISMLNLAKHLYGKGDLPVGTWYRENDEIKNTGDYELVGELDTLPFIDREIIPWKRYHEAWMLHDKVMYMMGSRGCPYRCSFCSWPQMLFKKKVRQISPRKILDEMKFLIDRYGVKEFFFDDDTFTYDKKWVFDLCNGMIEQKFNVIWGCNGRVDNCDEELLTAMKKSGCWFIKFGVESSSQYTLDRINKAYKVEDIIRTFKIAKKFRIKRHATVMLGYPWETRQDVLNTIEFVKKLDVDTCQFSNPVVYPGTKLFEEAKENNWLRFNEGEWEKFDMSEPTLVNKEFSPKEIMEICHSAWKQIYFKPGYFFKRIKEIRNFNNIKSLYRGARSVYYKSHS